MRSDMSGLAAAALGLASTMAPLLPPAATAAAAAAAGKVLKDATARDARALGAAALLGWVVTDWGEAVAGVVEPAECGDRDDKVDLQW